MMKITKYGRVVVTADEILITDFEFDFNDGVKNDKTPKIDTTRQAALSWVYDVITKALNDMMTDRT